MCDHLDGAAAERNPVRAEVALLTGRRRCLAKQAAANPSAVSVAETPLVPDMQTIAVIADTVAVYYDLLGLQSKSRK
jgi:hypothetical protein